MLSFSAVFVDWSAVGGCRDVFEVNRWNVSGTKPARSLPSLRGKPRQIIRELTATKIEWARFSLFCVRVCVPAMRFSRSRSLSIPHSFPPAVILVLFLFEHSPSVILTWLLAYLLHYQASVAVVKCMCKCLRYACSCVNVCMRASDRTPLICGEMGYRLCIHYWLMGFFVRF